MRGNLYYSDYKPRGIESTIFMDTYKPAATIPAERLGKEQFSW
jgi:hypothetical protein